MDPHQENLQEFQQEQQQPKRRKRNGHACPFGCNDGEEFKPLLMHYVKVHLMMNDEEITSLPKGRCDQCGLAMRGALIPVHKTLMHHAELPDMWKTRLEEVASGAFQERAAFVGLPYNTARFPSDVNAVAARVAADVMSMATASTKNTSSSSSSSSSGSNSSYYSSSASDFSDDDDQEQEQEQELSPPSRHERDPLLADEAMPTLEEEEQAEADAFPQRKANADAHFHVEEAEQLSLSQWEVLYRMIRHELSRCSFLIELRQGSQSLEVEVPLCLVPATVNNLREWGHAWNLDVANNFGLQMHFLVRDSGVYACLSGLILS